MMARNSAWREIGRIHRTGAGARADGQTCSRLAHHGHIHLFGREWNGTERSGAGGEGNYFCMSLIQMSRRARAGAGGRGRSSRVGDGTNQSKDGRHIWVSLEGQWPMDENGGRCTMPKAIGTSLGYVALVLAVEVGGIREQRPRGATAREDARRGEQRRGEGESMH